VKIIKELMEIWPNEVCDKYNLVEVSETFLNISVSEPTPEPE